MPLRRRGARGSLLLCFGAISIMLIDNMKRRLIVVFAVLLPVVIFVAMKWATRWRPAAIGNLTGVKPINWNRLQTFDVSDRYVIVGDNDNRVLFDLRSGQLRPSESEGITQDGTALWKAVENPRQLIIQNDSERRVYTMPWPEVSWMDDFSTAQPQVMDGPETTKVFHKYSLIHWNSDAPQTPKIVNCQIDLVLSRYALTRDGGKIINGCSDGITEVLARTGKVAKHIALVPKSTLNAVPRLSPFGTYALYEEGIAGSPYRCRIVDASTGHTLWRFVGTEWEMYLSEISRDEEIIAIPLFSRKVWQIHDLKTGKLLRTLPLAPGFKVGAFSPDGNTLYSITNGILYRQRAR